VSHDFADRATPLFHAIRRAQAVAAGDEPAPAWDDAPEWRRQGAVNGVLAILAAPDEKGANVADATCRAAILALAPPDDELLAARLAGGVPGGRTIAEHLVDAYGIEPVLEPDGALALHFVALGVVVETQETMQAQAELFTDAALRAANIEGVRRWQETLTGELARVIAALSAGVK
jgi:hypothetical protein